MSCARRSFRTGSLATLDGVIRQLESGLPRMAAAAESPPSPDRLALDS
jgi:hypothetical protein